MYPEEYTESLKYQYCRSPHYLKPEIMNNKEFSPRKQNGNVEFLWEGNTTRKFFRVSIVCDAVSMQILEFDCVCEYSDRVNTSHYRVNAVAVVSRQDKSTFRASFRPYVVTDPQERRESSSLDSPSKEKTSILFEAPLKIDQATADNSKELRMADTVKQWIAGKQVPVPDLAIAMKSVSKTSPLLAHECLEHFRDFCKSEHDWPLYAFFVVGAYIRINEHRNDPELRVLYAAACDYQRQLNGFNPWQNRMAYNPLENLISLLSFVNEGNGSK